MHLIYKPQLFSQLVLCIFCFQLYHEDSDVQELALKCLSLLVQLFGGESKEALSPKCLVCSSFCFYMHVHTQHICMRMNAHTHARTHTCAHAIHTQTHSKHTHARIIHVCVRACVRACEPLKHTSLDLTESRPSDAPELSEGNDSSHYHNLD